MKSTTIALIIFILLLVGGGVIWGIYSIPTTPSQRIVGFPNLDNPQGEAKLDFCSTENACIDYLKNQGMPDGFLEEKEYTIECSYGNCYLREK